MLNNHFWLLLPPALAELSGITELPAQWFPNFASEQPGGLLKTPNDWVPLPEFLIPQVLKTCISNKFPDDVRLLIWGHTLGTQLYSILLILQVRN